MADRTLVNGQITDAVTQTNVKVVGEAPAQAQAMVYQTMAHALGLSMQNAVQTQQQMNTIGTAITSMSVNLLLSSGPAAAGTSAQNLQTNNALLQLLTQLTSSLVESQQAAKTADRTPPTTG